MAALATILGGALLCVLVGLGLVKFSEWASNRSGPADE